MERREKILGGLRLAELSGVEIGALAWPLVRKSDGDVTYVDFTDAETLRKNHAAAGNVPLEHIVEVDAIWGANTLQEAIGLDRKVDYVIASHVIEHVPDMITWLHELVSVLRDGGEIRLAVPDRRFTFDYLRRETSAAEVVAAHMHRSRMPTPLAVLDFITHYVDVDKAAMWAGEIDGTALAPANGLREAVAVATDAMNGTYRDVHCWVFTPRSLGLLFAELARGGMLPIECTAFHDTAEGEYEFFVGARACASVERAAASWEAIAARARVDVPGSPEARAKAAEQVTSDLREQLRGAQEEASALRLHIAALKQSKSWRVTAPLRALRRR